jgi:hypothetical protein
MTGDEDFLTLQIKRHRSHLNSEPFKIHVADQSCFALRTTHTKLCVSLQNPAGKLSILVTVMRVGLRLISA